MGRTFGWGRWFGYGAMWRIRKLRIPFLAFASGAVLTASAAVAQDDPVTVAALGDSLTAGYGLPTDQGFVPVMQAWLDAQGADARLINAGVSGDTTAGGLARVDWTLTDDVDAMIVALGGNDYLRGVDPAASRANLKGILQAAQDREVDVLLVGVQVGNNYGPEYKQSFDGMYTDLAAEFDVPLVPSWFEGIAALASLSEGAGTYFQADGIHPNAQGVEIIVDTMGPNLLTLIAHSKKGARAGAP